jgi:hypothetical protein
MPAPLTSLDQLTDGVKVIARFAKRDNEDGDAPDYGQPKTVTLIVQRREKTLKRGRQVYPAGQIVLIAVRDFGWAEYSEDDYSPEYNEFLCEEYRMKILEVL